MTFNGQFVKESKDLPHIVGESNIGHSLPMVVWRGGKKVTLKVTVGEFEKAEKEGLIALGLEEEKKTEKAEQVMGIVTRKVTPGIRERYKLSSDMKGVFVAFVAPNSEAFTKFLRPGDIIQQLTSGSMKISPEKPEDIQGFVKNIKESGKKKVLLLVNTHGNLRYVALSLEDKKEDKESLKPTPLN